MFFPNQCIEASGSSSQTTQLLARGDLTSAGILKNVQCSGNKSNRWGIIPFIGCAPFQIRSSLTVSTVAVSMGGLPNGSLPCTVFRFAKLWKKTAKRGKPRYIARLGNQHTALPQQCNSLHWILKPAYLALLLRLLNLHPENKELHIPL